MKLVKKKRNSTPPTTLLEKYVCGHLPAITHSIPPNFVDKVVIFTFYSSCLKSNYVRPVPSWCRKTTDLEVLSMPNQFQVDSSVDLVRTDLIMTFYEIDNCRRCDFR